MVIHGNSIVSNGEQKKTGFSLTGKKAISVLYLCSIKETIVRERETRKSMKEIKILAPYE